MVNYILTPNYFTKTKLATTLVFKKSMEYLTYFDTNDRSQVIEYTEGMKYSDLNLKYYDHLSDNLITDSIDKFRINSVTLINGIRYYASNDITSINCLIYDSEVMKLTEAKKIIKGEAFTIVISSELAKSWSLEDYVNFTNTPGVMLLEVLNEEKFCISNFENINMKFSRELNVNNTYPLRYNSIEISETDIIAGWVNHIKKTHPRYYFMPELSDLSSQDQKTDLIFYDAKLTTFSSEYGTNPIVDPIYGVRMQVQINIMLEYLSDDMQNYIRFRNEYQFANEFHQDTRFSIFDSKGVEWFYTIDWEYDIPEEIERNPSTRYLEETTLYSVKFSCKVIGWLVEKVVDRKTILYPILRFYDESWRLILSIFDKSNPNVKYRLALMIDDTDFILMEFKDKLYINKFSINNNELNVNELTEPIDLNNTESIDSAYIEIKTNTPINPIDIDHGVFYYNNQDVIKVLPDPEYKDAISFLDKDHINYIRIQKYLLNIDDFLNYVNKIKNKKIN